MVEGRPIAPLFPADLTPRCGGFLLAPGDRVRTTASRPSPPSPSPPQQMKGKGRRRSSSPGSDDSALLAESSEVEVEKPYRIPHKAIRVYVQRGIPLPGTLARVPRGARRGPDLFFWTSSGRKSAGRVPPRTSCKRSWDSSPTTHAFCTYDVSQVVVLFVSTREEVRLL